MTTIETAQAIFGIFHDGTIIDWTGDKNQLTLKISCQYLAEKIQPDFEYFYIRITGIYNLAFLPWMHANEDEQEFFIELNHIFQAELDIISAEIAQDCIKVSCSQRNPDIDYSGGSLYIGCTDIIVLDEMKNELPVSELDEICKNYWDEFGK